MTTAMTKAINPIVDSRIRVEVLDDGAVRRIHTATLEIIESVGVRFPSERALDIWAANGATVDHDTGIVRAPGALIETALGHAPAEYTLAARDPSQDLPLDGRHVYAGTDGCGIEVVDLETGELRRSTLRDVAEIARVADALEEVAFHWVAVSAQDQPAESRGLHELAAIWSNSTKHVQTESIVTEREARAAVEMAAVVAGSHERLRERPVLSLMECTTSPLGQDGGAIDAGLVCAEAGIPVGFMTMASCAFTGPASRAGTLVVGNAEVISALALMQLAYPGCPVYYAAAQTAMDLRSGAYTGGGPEDFAFGAATNALADFYDLPLSMGAFATGAHEPDWQAGLENGLSAFLASAVGSDMLLGVGLLNGSRIWSYEQLLLDCEIYAIVRETLKGVVVDDETLAPDVIRSVGPGGDYLAETHTRKHMRELWQPRLLDRRPHGTWLAGGDRPRDRARERARALLAEHRPQALDEAVAQALAAIISGVEADARGVPALVAG
jgi:trimethylamine--corrinoid protein Co-methyltransferase